MIITPSNVVGVPADTSLDEEEMKEARPSTQILWTDQPPKEEDFIRSRRETLG